MSVNMGVFFLHQLLPSQPKYELVITHKKHIGQVNF